MPTALVIGNSDGIGLALTKLLLGQGWQVTGISRSASSVTSEHYAHHVLDVREPQYTARLAELTAALGALDVCVYCVGIGEFLDVASFSAERRVFEVNLLGAVATIEIVIPAMIRAGKGHFIGLSSLADLLIDPLAPSYAASKAGLTSYLEAIALACRPRGVHVTNLRFGFVDTKMAKAPVRPLLMTPEKAAERILYCIRKRPIRDSFPRRMALLVRLLGFLARFRGRFA
jgi:NAD(P)-dependent dehydrogenase (short-subunit alcohol dehydrogenase family)